MSTSRAVTGSSKGEASREVAPVPKGNPPTENEKTIMEAVMEMKREVGELKKIITDGKAKAVAKNARRRERKRLQAQKSRKAEMNARKPTLEDDEFEVSREAEASVQGGEVPPGGKQRGGQTHRGSPQPAHSEARSLSVFHRMGKRLPKNDLRHKLEGSKSRSNEEQTPSQRKMNERPLARRSEPAAFSHHEARRARSPPKEDRRRSSYMSSRHHTGKDECSVAGWSRARVRGQSYSPPLAGGEKKVKNDKNKVGDLGIEDLSKIIEEQVAKKANASSLKNKSPFTEEIKVAQLLSCIHGHSAPSDCT